MKHTSILFSLFIVEALIVSSCSNKAPEAPKAPPPAAVNIYEVKKESAIYFDVYPATVAALNQVDLKAQVTGYITGIYFTDGQHVSKGQKLYDIDKQQYQAAYEQTFANWNVAKANQDKLQQDVDRYNDLLKQDAIAKQIVDHAIADLQSAKMQVASAKAAVTRTENDLHYSTIYASFAGTIGISQVKTGTLVTANQTLLNTVSSDNPMAVDIALDQKEIPRFVQLQKNTTALKDSTFTLQLTDNSVYNQPGSISLIDRAVDPQTGTIKMRLVFTNPQNILKAGMVANIHVKNNNTKDLFLMIPYKAVVEQMGEYFVFVVNDSSKVNQHKILPGVKLNDKIVVKEGIKEGDKIVTDGLQKLKEGSAVQIAAPAKK